MRSKKTRVISTRRAEEVISTMLHSWAVDVVAGMGASLGLGAVAFGHKLMETQVLGDWVPVSVPESRVADRFIRERPMSHSNAVAWSEPGEMSAPIGLASTDDGAARSHLVTLAVADDALLDAARMAIRDFRLRQRAMGNSWRRRMATTRAAIRLGALVSLARAELVAMCYPARKAAKGSQCISTGTRRKLPVGAMTWNGKPAWRAPVGRPALPEAEWLARYRARRTAVRKGKSRPRRKPMRKAPPVKHKRPERARKLKCESLGLRDVLLSNVSGESVGEFFAEAESTDEIAGELA